ncbi:unnamed protein product, partial [Gulo gulo]
MASQSQGIQQLLQAEKRAAEKVADARKRKARRLKQAKEEAQMEVEQYRREREQEFQSKQQADPPLHLPGPFFLCFCFCLSLFYPFPNPPRPWAPRGTCQLRWNRLQDARCRACRALSRETENASWPNFLAWFATS